MTHDVYKHIEITGTSNVSSEQAIRHAIEKAGATIRRMHAFEVLDVRGDISGNSVSQWHVTLRIAFALE
jgi:flavin-binding protein dodecin